MASWHLNFDMQIWIGILCFASLCISIIICSLCFLIYEFSESSKNKKKNQINSKVKYCSIMSLASFACAILFTSLYIGYVKLPTGKVTSFTQTFWSFYQTFWSFGYFFTYLLFYFRLQQTFNSTMQKLTTLQSSIFLVLLIAYIVDQLLMALFWIPVCTYSITWDTFNTVYQPALITRIIIDFLLNAYIVYLFCSKIYQITVSTKTVHVVNEFEDSVTTTATTTSAFTNDVAPQIFEVMIKYFLLTFITVLSTQLYTASEIVLSESIDHAIDTNDFEFYYKTYILYVLLACTDGLVSTSYVMLSFPFAKPWYNKYCFVLHSICMKIWTKNIVSSHDHEMESFATKGMTSTGNDIQTHVHMTQESAEI